MPLIGARALLQAGEQLVLSGSSTDNLSSGTTFTSIDLQGGNTTLSGNQITLISAGAIASTGANNSIGQAIQLGSNITISATSGSLTLAGPINNNGYQLTLAAAAGSAVSIQGIVSGAGGLTASGSGTEILSGTNTYSGTTTISGGTLQLGDGVTRNGVVAGNITDNATLAFANPFAQTYTGIVSGTGSLVKSGPGTLTLTAAQTYTGSTTVSGGTLELANTPIPAASCRGKYFMAGCHEGTYPVRRQCPLLGRSKRRWQQRDRRIRLLCGLYRLRPERPACSLLRRVGLPYRSPLGLK